MSFPSSFAFPGSASYPLSDGWMDINSFPRLSGESDDFARFTRALAATDYLFVSPKRGGGSWELPFSDNSGVIVGSGKTIMGMGRQAPISCPGGDTADTTHSCFRVADGSAEIIFDNLWFTGDNGSDANPGAFVYSLNKQSTCIDILLTTTRDVTIKNCTAEFLHGFSFHDRGTLNKRTHVLHCTTRYCANGININAEDSKQIGNSIFHSEGFEASGVGILIANNVIREALGNAIDIGGSALALPGIVVCGNVIEGSTVLGIRVGDGVQDAVISGNTLIDVTGYSYSGGSAFGGFEPKRIIFANNTILNAGTNAIYANTDDTAFIGNLIQNSGQDCIVGAANGISFYGNRCHSAIGRAIQLTDECTNCYWDDSNVYAPYAYYHGGATTTSRFTDGSSFKLTGLPAASALFRGVAARIQGGAGVADIFKICKKDAADAYAWTDV